MNKNLFSFVLMIALILTLFVVPATSEEQIMPIVPYAVTAPSQVDELWDKDIGRSFILGASMTPTYSIEVQERGYLIFRQSRYYTVRLWNNASLTSQATKWSDWGGYLLDPGTYYLSVSMSTSPADKSLYTYFLPLSAYVNVAVTVDGDHADITVNLLGEGMDESKVAIKWIDDHPQLKDANHYATPWKNKAEGRGFTVTKNGDYSVHMYTTQEAWKNFPAALDFKVEGIVDATEAPTDEPTAAPIVIEPAPEEKKNVTVSGVKYSLSGSKATVTGMKNKNAAKLTIPATVKANGKTYKVTAVKASACKGMKKLSTLVLGKNVKTIGKNAFYGCKALKTITIKTTKLTGSSVGANAFKGILAKVKITCPSGKKSAYKKLLQKRGVGKKATFK